MLKSTKIIRQPAVAGQFYPADKNELRKTVAELLSTANSPEIKAKPQLLIVPHAGYVFSGPTAAHGFKTLAGQTYNTVIILGSSHNYPINGLALYDGDAVATPLGEIPVNQELTDQLIVANNLITADNDVHAPEHSLEVQLPFLQEVLKNNFNLILGLINTDDNNTLSSISQTINSLIDQNTLLVVSSDLSHYPDYDDAIYSDAKTIDAILTKNIDHFDETINSIVNENKPNLDTCACGSSAIKLGVLIVNENNWTGELLHYSNSGDTPNYGDPSRVVGYGAVLFSDSNISSDQSHPSQSAPHQSNFLSPEEQQIALALARHTLKSTFDLTDKSFTDYQNYPIFSEKRGVFVTLNNKSDHNLRGCIGLIEPIQPLAKGIIEMAESAAFHDPRFTPLAKEELNQIKIEISVLTPPEKISDPLKEIELGHHGVIIKQGPYSGVYLPQVATDTNWDLATFLSSLCRDKAGLSPNCYLDPTTEIYTFEAQVFAE